MQAAENGKIAGWGMPGTPLLPDWFLSQIALSEDLVEWNGTGVAVGELNTLWFESSAALSMKNEAAIYAYASQRLSTTRESLADIEICTWGRAMTLLPALPLRTRTRNQIQGRMNRLNRDGIFDPFARLSVQQCLDIPNLGAKSVLDFACVMQTALAIWGAGSESSPESPIDPFVHAGSAEKEGLSMYAVENGKIAGWGMPGTPLLPDWFLSQIALSEDQVEWNGSGTAVDELNTLWVDSSAALSMKSEKAIYGYASQRLTTTRASLADIDICSWGQAVDLVPVLPLRMRTRNQIQGQIDRAKEQATFDPSSGLSVQDCLDIPNLGVKSVLDFACVMQAALATWGPGPDSSFGSGADPTEDPNELVQESALLRWIQEFSAQFDLREMEILAAQVANKRGKLQTDIAKKYGITRQRASQIALRMEREFDASGGDLAAALADEIRRVAAPVMEPEAFASLVEIEIAEALGVDGATYEPSDNQTICLACLRARVEVLLDRKQRSAYLIDDDTEALVAEISSLLRESLDDCALTPRSEVDFLVMGRGSSLETDLLIDLVGAFQRGSFVTFSKSRRSAVKAALLGSDAPLDVSEIAAIVRIPTGRMSASLSGIPSVCRVDRTRWWIRDRVDVPYSGIADEIERRIRANGGYGEYSELLREIPEQFGVSPASVETYISTLAFEVQGEYVFLRDPESIHLRPLSEVIDGFDQDGFPHWSFEVTEHHFRGYGVSGVPPEFVVHLGCSVDGLTSIPLLNGSIGETVTASWRLKAVTGAYLGNFSSHLREIDANAGDFLRVTAVTGGLTIELDSPS